MTFKTEVLSKILNTTLSIAIQSDLFDPDSVERAIDLAEILVDEIELENGEDDAAVHNAVAETLKIYALGRALTDDGSVPDNKQADAVFVSILIDLLKERNEQIHLNDILGD